MWTGRGHSKDAPSTWMAFFHSSRCFDVVMLSDGVLHENERELLAELLYLLQTEGIDLSRVGLE